MNITKEPENKEQPVKTGSKEEPTAAEKELAIIKGQFAALAEDYDVLRRVVQFLLQNESARYSQDLLQKLIAKAKDDKAEEAKAAASAK